VTEVLASIGVSMRTMTLNSVLDPSSACDTVSLWESPSLRT